MFRTVRLARRVVLSCSLVCGLIAFSEASAVAQNVRPPNRPPQMQREPVKAAGSIKEAMGGMLHVIGAGGDQWLVRLDPQPRSVSFMGTAEESWLQPGMLVRFTGIMDRRGKILEPLSSLSVVSMRQGYVFGVSQEGAGAAAAGNEGPKLFEDPKPEKPVAPAKKPAGPVEPAAVMVIGRITSHKPGKLTIDAGTRKELKVELQEGAKISVDVADLSWAKAGDKVEIDGWAYPQQKQNVFAQEITVTASNPLVNEKKRPPPKDTDKDADKEGEVGEKNGKDGDKKPAEKPAEKAAN